MILHYQVLMKSGETLEGRHVEEKSAQILADKLKILYPESRAIASWELGAYADDFDVIPIPNVFDRGND